MSDKRWKSTERKVAAYLGGTRVPVTGRQRGSAPDIEHPFFSVEVKDRDSLPDWLFDAMAQAEASKQDDQKPLVVLHQKGQAIADCLTIMRLEDIMNLYRQVEQIQQRYTQTIWTKFDGKIDLDTLKKLEE